MVFFNDFVNVFEHSISPIVDVFTNPIKTITDPIRKPIESLLPKSIKDEIDETFESLDPVAILEHAMNNPEDFIKGGDIAGEVLEVFGAITGQPEIVALGAGVKGGADLLGGLLHLGQAVKGQDLGGIITSLGDLGGKLSGLALLEEEENTRLNNISKTLKGVGKHVADVDKALGITNKLLKQEIKADITNNEQMKQFIQENHGENEALKHGQVTLNKELQALNTEEKKEEDVLNQIRTAIDTPFTDSDFVKDIDNFNNPKAILEYLAENLLQIEGLQSNELNAILDLALTKGVLNAI